MGVGTRCADLAKPVYQQKLALKLAFQRWSLSEYIPLAD
jgi:hypothetical protein